MVEKKNDLRIKIDLGTKTTSCLLLLLLFFKLLFFWRISIDPSVFNNEAGQLAGVLWELRCSEGSRLYRDIEYSALNFEALCSTDPHSP